MPSTFRVINLYICTHLFRINFILFSIIGHRSRYWYRYFIDNEIKAQRG